MARIILFFLFSILFFLPFSDIEISLNFGRELGRFFSGLLELEVDSYKQLITAILHTLSIGITGVIASLVFGVFLSYFWKFKFLRVLLAYVRAVHELFWILLFIPFLGLTPFCGVMGIVVPYSAMFAKMINSLLENQKVPIGQSFKKRSLATLFYIDLPKIYPSLKDFIRFRLECGLRATTLMGFIGLPTLGYYMETAFAEGLYGQLWVLLIVFLLLTQFSYFYFKKTILLFLLVLSSFIVFKDFFFSLENFKKMMELSLIPWPVKQYLAGNTEYSQLSSVGNWFFLFFREKIWTGIWVTIVLTQVSLGLCFFLSLLSLPFASTKFVSRPMSRFTQFQYFLGRNIPEYILATLFLFLFGPSMIPAILALAFHNAGIVSHLSLKDIERMDFSGFLGKKKIENFLYIIIPKAISKITIYSTFRWEFYMREASILGFLGIKTLGFFADSAYHENKYDDLVLILFIMANLNLVVSKIGLKVQSLQSAE